MPKVTSPLRLTGLAAICRRFVLQPRSTSAPFLDPRPRTRATRWFVLAFTDALRRSPAESSQIFEKLSLPCYRDRPSRILPSLHSLGQFFSQPKHPVRRTSSLHFWHHALYRLFWASTQCLYIYPPAFYVYRRLGAAVLQLNFPLEAFFIAWCSPVVVSSPAFYVYRTSSAVWVPLFFRYSAFPWSYYFFIYSVSPVCPLLPLLFASGFRSEKRLFFPLSHSYAVPCSFNLLFTHCVTNVTHSLGLGLRVFRPVLPV